MTFTPKYVTWCVEHEIFRQWRVGDWWLDVEAICTDPDPIPVRLNVPADEVLKHAQPELYSSIYQRAGVGPGPRRVWLPTAGDWIELLSNQHGREGSFRDAAARESIVLHDVLEAAAAVADRRCEPDPLMAFARVWEVWSR